MIIKVSKFCGSYLYKKSILIVVCRRKNFAENTPVKPAKYDSFIGYIWFSTQHFCFYFEKYENRSQNYSYVLNIFNHLQFDFYPKTKRIRYRKNHRRFDLKKKQSEMWWALLDGVFAITISFDFQIDKLKVGWLKLCIQNIKSAFYFESTNYTRVLLYCL